MTGLLDFETDLKSYELSITELKLEPGEVRGKIPHSISSFSNLTSINLHGNELKGSIPPSISCLTNLQELKLRNNNLCNEIPREISCLTNLTALSLGKNKFINIPSTISCLQSLTILDLCQNKLSGEIPSSISCLTNLEKLNLSMNKLFGQIPDSISCLTRLSVLLLQKNYLSGKIPDSISCLQNITHLNFDNNYFKKPVPTCLKYRDEEIYIKDAFLIMNDKITKKIEKYKANIVKEKHKNIIEWNDIIHQTNYEIEQNDAKICQEIENLITQNTTGLPNEMNQLAHTSPYEILHEKEIYTWDKLLSHLKDIEPKIGSYLENISKQKEITTYQYKKKVAERSEIEKKLNDVIKEENRLSDTKNILETKHKNLEQSHKFIYNTIRMTNQITKLKNDNKYEVQKILIDSDNLSQSISEGDFKKILKYIHLSDYYDTCIQHKVHDNLLGIKYYILLDIGFTTRDACCFLYNIEMMQHPNYFNESTDDICVACNHNTPIKTIELLEEYKIKVDRTIIKRDNWKAQYLLKTKQFKDIGISSFDTIYKVQKEWQIEHKKHLKKLSVKK